GYAAAVARSPIGSVPKWYRRIIASSWRATRKRKRWLKPRSNKRSSRTSLKNSNDSMKTSTNKTTEAPKLYETENDIPKAARVEMIALMGQRLADVIDLQLQ